jgi:Family of unknown function (DUF5372)
LRAVCQKLFFTQEKCANKKRKSANKFARNRKLLLLTPPSEAPCAPVASNQSPPATSRAVLASAIPFRWWLVARRICLSLISCNSIQNANASIVATRLVRITHPFHPLSGRQLPCVGERYNRYGMTLLLQIDDESVCSVPPQWSDVVAVDPEIAMGGHRALFRVVDLLELAGLVDRLSKRVGRRS